MKRKTTCAFLLATAVFSGIFVWWLMPHEPSYDGTSLSGWLQEFDHEKFERRLMAAEAVRHIGPKAVPCLAGRLQSLPMERPRPSHWKVRLLDWLGTHTSIKISPQRDLHLRRQAMAAFDALGPEAKDALPVLEQWVERNPPDPQAHSLIPRLRNPR